METHNCRSCAFFHRSFQKYCPLKAVVLGYTCKHSMQYIPLKHIYILLYIIYMCCFFIHILSTQKNQIPKTRCGATLPGASSLADSLRRAGIVARDSLHDTVDGSEIRPSPVEVDRLCHYLQGFLHPRWCRISAINSSFGNSPGHIKEV